jgi:short-subunit dehydrogenase
VLNPRVTDWRGRRVWLVGASSGIGEALARALIERGARVAVSARRADSLQSLAGQTQERWMVLPLDVTDASALRTATSTLLDAWGGIDLVVWLAATYAPMRADQFDLASARQMLEINLGAVYNGLDALLPVLFSQRYGGIALVSSVAGYRGLPRALAYGPSKAGLINLAESLWLDLHPQGIGVWLINPGVVSTPLTAKNDFQMPAIITTDQAAQHIIRGLERGGFEIHFPRRFTLWMKLLRILPARLSFALLRRATGG